MCFFTVYHIFLVLEILCLSCEKLMVESDVDRELAVTVIEVKVYVRGWLGYNYVADMKRILQSWNGWLRRRFRVYIWK